MLIASALLATHHSSSPQETEALARLVATKLQPGDIIGLDGDLGAGKTCFTRGLVSGLSGASRAHVSSPTFALLNVYPTDPPVYHFDFYRLADFDDLETTGYWDIVQRGDGIVVVEWCQRIPDAFDDRALIIEISTPESSSQRILTLRGSRDRFPMLISSLEESVENEGIGGLER